MEAPAATLAGLQGAYFAVTGVWPILHIASFEAVTGPKVDDWLVKTVGALVAVIGATLCVASWLGRVSPEAQVLAMGSALCLGAVDVVYPLLGRISRVYLADAVVEATLLAAWTFVSV